MKPRTNEPLNKTRAELRVEPHDLRAIDVGVLQTLFDLAPDVAFFVKDAYGRYVAVNDSLVARHGLKQKSDAIGKRPRDICPGDFGRIPTEQDERVLRTGKAVIDHLELQWHRPREPVWCLTTKLPLRNEKKEIVGLIGFSRDLRAPVESDEIPRGFAAALAEFEQNLDAEFTPATLAIRSQLSPQRLGRLTKRLFGLTPSQLLAKARITAASRLLRETEQSVAAIATTCGYSDQSAFTRAFRSFAGQTPLEYRRMGTLSS